MNTKCRQHTEFSHPYGRSYAHLLLGSETLREWERAYTQFNLLRNVKHTIFTVQYERNCILSYQQTFILIIWRFTYMWHSTKSINIICSSHIIFGQCLQKMIEIWTFKTTLRNGHTITIMTLPLQADSCCYIYILVKTYREFLNTE